MHSAFGARLVLLRYLIIKHHAGVEANAAVFFLWLIDDGGEGEAFCPGLFMSRFSATVVPSTNGQRPNERLKKKNRCRHG